MRNLLGVTGQENTVDYISLPQTLKVSPHNIQNRCFGWWRVFSKVVTDLKWPVACRPLLLPLSAILDLHLSFTCIFFSYFSWSPQPSCCNSTKNSATLWLFSAKGSCFYLISVLSDCHPQRFLLFSSPDMEDLVKNERTNNNTDISSNGLSGEDSSKNTSWRQRDRLQLCQWNTDEERWRIPYWLLWSHHILSFSLSIPPLTYLLCTYQGLVDLLQPISMHIGQMQRIHSGHVVQSVGHVYIAGHTPTITP